MPDKRRRQPRKKEPAPPPPLTAWDRQPGETPQSFHAFTIYRDLAYQRSLARVASELVSSGRRRGNPMTMRKDLGVWSKRHRWVERVTAWDREVDRQHQIEEQRTRLEMRRRQADLGQAFQTTLSLPVRALIDKLQTNPQLVEQLADEDVVVLLQLAAQSARALPAVVAVEVAARGEDAAVALAYQQEEEVDREAEEQRLRRVAAIMNEYGLFPGGSGQGELPPGPS